MLQVHAGHCTISCATKHNSARSTAIIRHSIKTDFTRKHKARTSLARFPGCTYYTERRTSQDSWVAKVNGTHEPRRKWSLPFRICWERQQQNLQGANFSLQKCLVASASSGVTTANLSTPFNLHVKAKLVMLQLQKIALNPSTLM